VVLPAGVSTAPARITGFAAAMGMCSAASLGGSMRATVTAAASVKTFSIASAASAVIRVPRTYSPLPCWGVHSLGPRHSHMVGPPGGRRAATGDNGVNQHLSLEEGMDVEVVIEIPKGPRFPAAWSPR